MDLDETLRCYFGTSELRDVSPEAQAAGIEQMRADFELEREKDKRFALWSALYLLRAAPDLEVAFKDQADDENARNIMDPVAGGGEAE